jgi:K+-transporting ATPase ATPase C chain
MRNLLNELNTSIRITLLIALLCGLAYPLVMTGVAQVAFNGNANGSLITNSGGDVVGSSLIGQCYYKTGTDKSGNLTYLTTKDDHGNSIFVIDPRYFQSRPSFTVDASGKPLPCNAANSTGTNLAPSSKTLISRVTGYVDYLHSLGVAKNPDGSNAPMPVDLVTGDFTGFDPDISEAGTLAQVNMVAAARHLDPAKLQQFVETHVAGRSLGIFGAPHVNVLSLNMALDAGAAS